MISLSDQKASSLLESMYTAVLVFDGELRLAGMNSAGEHLLSLSSRKIGGLRVRDILPSATGLAEMLERARLAGNAYTEWGMELDLGHGRVITVDAVVTPVLEGKGSEVILELIDVKSAVRARRDEHLAVMHDAARKSLQGVAHEIKNPLGGLRGAAQLLERELNGSTLTEYTQIIISEADRLRNLVDRMLAPNGHRRPAPVNIHEVLEYVITVMEAETRRAIERDYDPSLPALEADREHLIQSFLNIVRNATQAAGPAGSVCVRTRVKRNCTIGQRFWKLALQVEVIDDGPGVPPEISADFFYPLVTSRADGTGLGLSIAQSLVQSQHGMIEYERSEDRTTFRILLPLE